MATTIKATKNGRERSFSKITWDALGDGKAGWEQVKTAKAPEETKTKTQK